MVCCAEVAVMVGVGVESLCVHIDVAMMFVMLSMMCCGCELCNGVCVYPKVEWKL